MGMQKISMIFRRYLLPSLRKYRLKDILKDIEHYRVVICVPYIFAFWGGGIACNVGIADEGAASIKNRIKLRSVNQ
jgi:hypothetical protein